MGEFAVITGGSGGIGAATARALRHKGYRVHLAGRRREALARVAEEIGGSYTACDLSTVDGCDILRKAVGDDVRVVVHTAGRLEVAPVSDHAPDLFDDLIAANLRSAFLVTRALLPALKPGSRVIYTSSVAGRKGLRNLGAYSASKADVIAFAESFAAEVESRGIGVHILELGSVATPMLDRPGASPYQLDPSAVADVVGFLAQLPDQVVLRELTLRAVTSGPFANAREGPTQ